MLKKAFTLIELLVVIGIMAVLAAGVVALIDPIEKTRQANDSSAINAIGQVATAMQSSAAQNTQGYYPQPAAAGNTYDVFVTNGELKVAPTLPTGSVGGTYSMVYAVNANPSTESVVYVNLLAKKHTSSCTGATPTAYWFFATPQGRACGICLGAAPTSATACPATSPF